MMAKESLQTEALRLVFKQFIIAMVLTIIVLLVMGFKKGFSVFLGSSAYIIPQFIFAWLVFFYAKIRLIDWFMITFFIGEVIKLVISAFLFIFIVNYFPINLIFTMTGYIIAIISFWFVCGWHFGQRHNLKSGSTS